MVSSQSLYWFDYETFGISPAWDRPAQFAGRRTNLNLQPIGDPLVVYCRPPGDYLPDPHACRITGLQPPDILNRGLPEAKFIQQVVSELGHPGTCSVGYNNIRFDDEFTRFTLFRNFHDPYEQEWKNDNSRWDLLDVVRLTRALRPDGITWPILDNKPSNRLEHITAANGLEHSQAHDALSDVDATIAVARLIKDKQPRLYDYAFSHRDKHSVNAMLNVRERSACILISGMISSAHGHAAVVVPVARHPENPNAVIVLDLRNDPAELNSLNPDEIRARVFSPVATADERPRLGLRTVQINRCPVLVPLSTLRDADAERLNINLAQHHAHNQSFQQIISDELCERIRQAMHQSWDGKPADVDGSLYSGNFLNQHDKQRLAKLREALPQTLADFHGLFDDQRLDQMLLRYRARNYNETLTAEEQLDWRDHIQARLNSSDAPWLTFNKFYEEMNNIEWPAEEAELKASLIAYAESLAL